MSRNVGISCVAAHSGEGDFACPDANARDALSLNFDGVSRVRTLQFSGGAAKGLVVTQPRLNRASRALFHQHWT